MSDTPESSTSVVPAVDPLNNFFSQSGSNFFVKSKMSEISHKKLPGGNYAIKHDPRIGFFLEKIADFPEPKKIYGNAKQYTARIYNSFRKKTNNLGVVLTGEKGSGKTLQGREISRTAAKDGIPTLFVTGPYVGEEFFQFLYSIEQECIIFVDEYEKIYDNERQEKLLTLLDGVFQSRKMFILTCNDRYKINIHLRNRPGRVHYLIEYSGIEASFIREFCEDELQDKGKIEEVVTVCGMFSVLNFDMLQAIVWEMNLYKESAADALKLLNAKPDSDDYTKYETSLILGATKRMYSADSAMVNYFQPNGHQGTPLRKSTHAVVFEVGLNEFTLEEYVQLAQSDIINSDRDEIAFQIDMLKSGRYGRNSPKAIQAQAPIGSANLAPMFKRKPVKTSDVKINIPGGSGDAVFVAADETGSDQYMEALDNLESSADTVAAPASKNFEESNYEEVSMTIEFTMDDLAKVNTKDSSFSYQDKFGNVLTFTKEKPKTFDMGRVYDQLS